MNRFLSILMMGCLLVCACNRQPAGISSVPLDAIRTGDAPATPVYHLLDPKVSKASGYSKVIIR